MFNWITKPYIQWNILDIILFYVEVGIAFVLMVIIVEYIIEFKDKIKKKKGKQK